MKLTRQKLRKIILQEMKHMFDRPYEPEDDDQNIDYLRSSVSDDLYDPESLPYEFGEDDPESLLSMKDDDYYGEDYSDPELTALDAEARDPKDQYFVPRERTTGRVRVPHARIGDKIRIPKGDSRDPSYRTISRRRPYGRKYSRDD